MATTRLFIELLVIGIGVAVWLTLLLGAFLGWRFENGSPNLQSLTLLPLTAVAYVLGIMTDRIARQLFETRAIKRAASLFKKEGFPSIDDAARRLGLEAEILWRTSEYNRSRLRICRAWTLNFALITLCYGIWNLQVGVHTINESIVVIAAGIVLCAVTGWITRQLYWDYHVQLRDSCAFLIKRATSPQTTPHNQRLQATESVPANPEVVAGALTFDTSILLVSKRSASRRGRAMSDPR